MKVPELREKLAGLSKEDIAKLAVEFYKLIPKSKKEQFDIDGMVASPGKKSGPVKKNEELSILEMGNEIKSFVANARGMCYISPNRFVPKKERSTWRFKAKKWYKELIKTNRADENLELQASLLKDLYELLCESCEYQYFTAFDTFESVGVAQTEFLASLIDMHHKAIGKPNSLEICIRLVVDNALNRYTLYSELMDIVISKHNTIDMLNRGIEISKALLQEHEQKTKNHDKKKSGFSLLSDYSIKEKYNNLVEFVLRFYLSLYENDHGISYFNALYKETNPEVRLYVLVRVLLEHKLADEIRAEMESKIQSGVKPREGLIKLLDIIKAGNPLPESIPW